MDNHSILKQLKLLVALMELHDENTFKIRGYQNAIFNLDKLVIELTNQSLKKLEGIDGVGKGIAATINEINQKGTAEALDQYLESTPEGIVELLDIKGIGPKKIKVLWKELGIESGYELKEAANTGLVAKLKGFGEKTQKTLLEALEFKEANANKLHYAEAIVLAEEIKKKLSSMSQINALEITSEIRRRLEVISEVELIAATEDINDLEEGLNGITDLQQHATLSGPTKWGGFYASHKIPIIVHFSNQKDFAKRHFILTGSSQHLGQKVIEKESLFDIANSRVFENEKNLYLQAGLDFISPELREATFEIDAAKNKNIPKLIEMSDLKGILHNHSTYSDGKHSLEQMAKYCKELGYEYLGVCDHSQSAFYANGLDELRVKKQHEEIARLNEELVPFKILKGIESDILFDGSLDYPDETLASFDFIVSSIHSVLNMNRQKATDRLLRAIENPYTTILGHPTGRLLLRRKGYPIDHKAVIDHCAKHNVVIEINANPWRLDLDWRWVKYAIDRGVKLAINPDAHEMNGYHHMEFGLLAGRKGGLTAEMTFNALNLADIEKHFAEKKSQVTANA